MFETEYDMHAQIDFEYFLAAVIECQNIQLQYYTYLVISNEPN